MSATLRPALRRKLLAIVAAPLLLAGTSAAATADQVTGKYTFYSSASYSQVVGYAFEYCDNDYIVASGYETAYSKWKFIAPCP